MTKIQWSEAGQKFYEEGLDRGVFYPLVGPGVPWNGLISVEESNAGGDSDSYYFDGIKYLDVVTNEDFQATLTAFAAPREFNVCDGARQIAAGLFVTQQPRKNFHLSYRTGLGNDILYDGYGYKLHLVYNALASPDGKTSVTRNEAPAPTELAWTINTVPPAATTFKPTAHFIVNSTAVDPAILNQLETLLYGDALNAPRLPSQTEVYEILAGL